MIVIDPTLRIIDYLIRLVLARKRDHRQDFEILVEPVFKDAEAVAKDYFQVISELARRIEEAKDIPSVILWLEERRVAYLPVRMKMRAYLRSFSYRSLDSFTTEAKPQSKDRDKFVSGIQTLLFGGLSLVEDGHIAVPGSASGHTLLDILMWDASKPFEDVKGAILQRAKRQQAVVNAAWAKLSKAMRTASSKHTGRNGGESRTSRCT